MGQHMMTSPIGLQLSSKWDPCLQAAAHFLFPNTRIKELNNITSQLSCECLHATLSINSNLFHMTWELFMINLICPSSSIFATVSHSVVLL